MKKAIDILAALAAVGVAACAPAQAQTPAQTPAQPTVRTVEVVAGDGTQLTVRDAVHVTGGADNGHWDTPGRPYTITLGPDTRYYAALSLCPGGDGVTLGPDGTGNRSCPATAALATLDKGGVLAKVTGTELREIYQP